MKRIAILILAIGCFLFAQTAQAATWATIQRLTWNSGISECPAVAVDTAGTIYVVWHDNTSGNYEIYYKKSINGGATWTANQKITSTSGTSKNPAIAIDTGGNIHVVWQDSTPGNAEIYYKKSTTGGATWTANKRLTYTTGYSGSPAIAVNSSGHLHLFWHDNTPGNYEIYYKKSVNGGDTWAANLRLTFSAGVSEAPAFAVDSSDYLHLAWQDDTPGNTEIYYKSSTNGGAAWTANQRLTSTAGSSLVPAIAADTTGHLYVAWYDDTTGNKEIYYKKGSTVSTTPITAYSSYDNTVCSSGDGTYADTVYWGTELGVGYDYFWSLVGWDFIFRASALKFDVQSQISGRSIKKATLRLYVYTLRGDFSITPYIRMSAFASDWNPNTLTCNIFETLLKYTSGEVVKEAPASYSVPYDFDATYIVKQWASGAWPNYGIMLVPEGHYYPGGPSLQGTLFQSLEYYYYANQRPQLLIEFQ